MSRRLEDLEPETRKRCVTLLAKAAEKGHALIIIQTLRTFEEQAGIYAQGRQRPGPVVTNARPGYSWHNFGRAFDVAFLDGSTGKITWDGPWDEIGLLGEGIGLEWGGRWRRLKDRPHFQFTSGMTLQEARNNRNVISNV